MRQFDICELKTSEGGLVVVLQHDLLDDLRTRIVAPLSGEPQRLINRLRVKIDHQGKAFVLRIDRLAAIPRPLLGPVTGRIEVEQDHIKRALDLAFFGI